MSSRMNLEEYVIWSHVESNLSRSLATSRMSKSIKTWVAELDDASVSAGMI